MDVGQLDCSLVAEKLSPTGQVTKRSVHRKASLMLERNEFKEIVLKVNIGNLLSRYLIHDIGVFQRFVKDGKATLMLDKENQRFLMSNCPPDKLKVFLKALTTKLDLVKMKNPITDRQRLFSEKQRTFQEISPLTLKDLNTVHSSRAKMYEQKKDFFTPKSKRKRASDNDKENVDPAMTKRMKLNGSAPKIPVISTTILSPEQKRVLETVLKGQNIFFTGSAGTGKSFLLKRIIGALPPQHTFATASTGVAACHIGGTTLHAFGGIGSGTACLEQCVELARRPAVAQQWRKCKHLIIDEISMVDGEFFNKLETVARVIKKNDKPFGGIQLILCGDFLQLPPVTKQNQKCKFAFQSRAWRHSIDVNMELTNVRRQSDPSFIKILQQLRLGRCTEEIYLKLSESKTHKIDKNGVLATRLCTHKEDVDFINQDQLSKIKAPLRTFEALDSDEFYRKTIDAQCPVKYKVDLKEGSQVMLAKNLDVQRGLVNGARGVVVGFEPGAYGVPKVRFLSGETVTINNERWTFKAAGGQYLTRKQLPLKLAWAISIHKSQGMSLDCVEISLARVFEEGQAYVALSRAKNIEGLRVLDFSRSCVRANPHVLKFYKNLQMTDTRQRCINLI